MKNDRILLGKEWRNDSILLHLHEWMIEVFFKWKNAAWIWLRRPGLTDPTVALKYLFIVREVLMLRQHPRSEHFWQYCRYSNCKHIHTSSHMSNITHVNILNHNHTPTHRNTHPEDKCNQTGHISHPICLSFTCPLWCRLHLWSGQRQGRRRDRLPAVCSPLSPDDAQYSGHSMSLKHF